LKPPSDQDWIAKYWGALIVCLVGIVASGYLRFTQPVSRSDTGERSNKGLYRSAGRTARAKMELFANDLLDIDHFSRGIKFFIFPQSNTSGKRIYNHKT
jgi:hypothetical protein